jgi:hypothetical protein
MSCEQNTIIDEGLWESFQELMDTDDDYTYLVLSHYPEMHHCIKTGRDYEIYEKAFDALLNYDYEGMIEDMKKVIRRYYNKEIMKETEKYNENLIKYRKLIKSQDLLRDVYCTENGVSTNILRALDVLFSVTINEFGKEHNLGFVSGTAKKMVTI